MCQPSGIILASWTRDQAPERSGLDATSKSTPLPTPQGRKWDDLSQSEQARIRKSEHWPLIQSSDPRARDEIGRRYSWLKMEVRDVEGIRLALLDPQSRLRRMEDGPPKSGYPRLTRVTIEKTDFFEKLDTRLSPSLNTPNGGRGTGKSTLIGFLRYGLDRNRSEDFGPDADSKSKASIDNLLREKAVRDFGQTSGVLLPAHRVRLEVEIAGSHASGNPSANPSRRQAGAPNSGYPLRP